MLDFQAVRDQEITFAELVAGLSRDDLRDLTNEMIDTMLGLILACIDADVVFEPLDPQAHDPFAVTPEEVDMAWNLGHVIVHTTASAEESAALAAELARGVENHGRSRYETPWQEMRTIEGCRSRLEESRRMRIASLEMWPAEPHLENAYQAWSEGPSVNAIGRFVLGLSHDESHLGQIEEIVRQAKGRARHSSCCTRARWRCWSSTQARTCPWPSCSHRRWSASERFSPASGGLPPCVRSKRPWSWSWAPPSSAPWCRRDPSSWRGWPSSSAHVTASVPRARPRRSSRPCERASSATRAE